MVLSVEPLLRATLRIATTMHEVLVPFASVGGRPNSESPDLRGRGFQKETK